MIENLFETELRERKIFRDLNILSPHYVPQELPHREAEIRDITRIIAPVLRNEKPNNAFIYGGTGTGKTCVLKYVLRKLNDFVKNPQKNLKGIIARYVYMNCKVRNSKYQVLLTTLEDDVLNDSSFRDIPLRDRPDKSLTGMDPADLYDRLFNVVQNNSINLIIVLDEIDQIEKGLSDLMYILTRINDDFKSGHVSVIGISNNMKFKNRLDPRSKSTLCEEERIFKPYNAIQLKTILKQRIQEGFLPDTVDDSVVSLIAAFAAQDGDARYALRLLQKSGEIAEELGGDKVISDYVERAKTDVEKDMIAEAISALPEHQQIVIYSIASLASKGGMYQRLSEISNGDLFTGEVYEAYENNCKALNRSPRTIRQFSDYLNELEMAGMITMRMSGKGIRGTTRLIRLGYPPNEIKGIVKKSLGLDNN